MNKNNRFSFLFIPVALAALTLAGCTSSPGSSSSTTSVATGTSGYVTCTTATSGAASECMPNLGQYGTTVVYEGLASITNTNLAGAFIHGVSYFQNDNIQASSLSQAYIVVALQATNNGPEINLTIQFPYANDSYGVLSGYTFGGYDTFTATNASASNDIGTIMMQPPAINSTTSFSVTSTQDWDGYYNYMTAVSVFFNGTLSGSVGLTRVE